MMQATFECSKDQLHAASTRATGMNNGSMTSDTVSAHSSKSYTAG